jgi:hypothetical protein
MRFRCWSSKPCFAAGCRERISRRLLMCKRHWAMVGHATRVEVYAALDVWQSGGSPKAYIAAIKKAASEVAAKEAKRPWLIEK